MRKRPPVQRRFAVQGGVSLVGQIYPRACARSSRMSSICSVPMESRMVLGLMPMASSDLRARLAAGEACENELPALVRRVIRREGLYRADRGESGNHESETGKGACARSVE